MKQTDAAFRRFWRWLADCFASQHDKAVRVFIDKGFTPTEAELAARHLWLACRRGQPTPTWIIDKLKALDV